jgi:hypothetical protein
MLARPPFAITEKLDAGAVHEQVQGAIGAPLGDLDGQRLRKRRLNPAFPPWSQSADWSLMLIRTEFLHGVWNRVSPGWQSEPEVAG